MRNATSRIVTPCLLAALLGVCVHPALAQIRGQSSEMRQRMEQRRFEQRVEAFVEDSFEFYEISGELVSFRVHPNMTRDELDLMEDKAEQLEDKADDLIDFIQFVTPRTRGNTDDLWVVLRPLDESSALEERLTVILALVNGIDPKLQHFIEILTEEREPSVDVEQLVVEATLPFLIAGGLEEIQAMVRNLRNIL